MSDLKEKLDFSIYRDKNTPTLLAYKDLENSFITFYQRNLRLKSSLSWKITFPIRRIRQFVYRWRDRFSKLFLAFQHNCIIIGCKKKSYLAFVG
ncbi:hypothetical protein FBY50_0498 [Zymomonas mobilis]|nr:hypothetical protein FBY55_1356 [Zymomonas mobilis]TQL29952.1 hypothetical protein FBY54_0788 [Zymomonas mobilis]TWD59701.1 hypothetical protein FBY50_0498 [Zymomonas mobilis]